jgi:hypothetical protein
LASSSAARCARAAAAAASARHERHADPAQPGADVFGDLDVSRIDELPPGRTPVKTKRFTPARAERLYGFIRREVRDGRQAYIIYPLVEESDSARRRRGGGRTQAAAKEIFPDAEPGPAARADDRRRKKTR